VQGLHVLVLSLACCPLMWLFCTFYAFYMGTLTWYNVFIHYNEQRTCCHTVRGCYFADNYTKYHKNGRSKSLIPSIFFEYLMYVRNEKSDF